MRPTPPHAFEAKQHSTGRGHFEALSSDGRSSDIAAQPLQTSAVTAPAYGSSAGTFDADADELYIRTYSRIGFQVIDTIDDSIARVITDATESVEDSRTGSFYDGFFYARAYDEPFQRFDSLDGTQTEMLAIPTSTNAATDTDFASGRIYVAGYAADTTSFQAYDTSNDVMIDLSDSPGVGGHSSITVMRP